MKIKGKKLNKLWMCFFKVAKEDQISMYMATQQVHV